MLAYILQLRALSGDTLPATSRLLADLGQVRTVTTHYALIPKVKHDPYKTPPKNYVQLLQHITRARDIKTLDRLVRDYGPKFDAVHVAAALSVMPKLHNPPAPGARLTVQQSRQKKEVPAKLLQRLQELASTQVPRMFPREAACVTWALGRCRSLLPGASGHNPATKQLIRSLMQRLTKDNNRMLYQAAGGAEVAKLLHGLARLKLGLLMQGTVQQLCGFVAKRPQQLHVKELAAVAWGLAKMQLPPTVAASAAAGDTFEAISRQVVAQKLYLRPAAMCSLATACARLGRKDEQLLAAVAEEAFEQIKDLRPGHLAVLMWAFGRLQYNPGQTFVGAATAAANSQLDALNSVQLGMLLNGLRQLGALDQQLLADVAAGISKEQEVALGPQDAVRILAAFVAQKHAGAVWDVEGMAARIGDAMNKRVASMSVGQIANLLVCYSKVPSHHPLLLRMLEEASMRSSAFSLDQWVRMLQSCERLGYSDPAARDSRVVDFYAAADQHLQRHLLGAVMPDNAAAGAAQKTSQQRRQQQNWWRKALNFLQDDQQQQSRQEKVEQHDIIHQQEQQPDSRQRHSLQFAAAIDVGVLLGRHKALSDKSAEYLADAGSKMLQQLQPRKLMFLLTAVTSGDRIATLEDVRKLLVEAAARLQQEDLSQLSHTVLAGLTKPLGHAVARSMLASSGEPLLQQVYQQLLPVLDECSEQQLQLVWDSMLRSGVQHEGLKEKADAIAAREGWQLPQDRGWGPLGI